MARRRVTYVDAADQRSARSAATGPVIDLDAWQQTPAEHFYAPLPRQRRECSPKAALLALVAMLAAGALLAEVTTSPEERAAEERALERQRPEVALGPAPLPVASRAGPVVVETDSVVDRPWRGVFEHHPDARGADPVPRVHLVSLAGAGGRGLLLVDATRRAFGGPEHPKDRDRAARVLGVEDGTGLRTQQWDAGGYGLSLTTVGLSSSAQHAVRRAVRVPDGASLQHGRIPSLDGRTLQDLGIAVTDLRSAAASAFGSPLIGQGGGASIEGQLHQSGRSPLLVSVVQDQLVDAASIRAALGPTAAIDASSLPGITGAAALDHGPAVGVDRRIRGWGRLVLDHAGGVTIELSSDVLRPAELLEAARAMDLDRLVRTTAPMEGSG